MKNLANLVVPAIAWLADKNFWFKGDCKGHLDAGKYKKH
jgi:hypothetical protein